MTNTLLHEMTLDNCSGKCFLLPQTGPSWHNFANPPHFDQFDKLYGDRRTTQNMGRKYGYTYPSHQQKVNKRMHHLKLKLKEICCKIVMKTHNVFQHRSWSNVHCSPTPTDQTDYVDLLQQIVPYHNSEEIKKKYLFFYIYI